MRKKNNTLILSVAAGLALLVLVGMLFVPTKGVTKLAGTAFLETYNSTPNAILVDVRTPAEFDAGHIANAINIDIENQSFGEQVKKLDPSRAYFVYCRSGNRSNQAVAFMKANGFKSVYELQGGLISNGDAVTLVTANGR